MTSAPDNDYDADLHNRFAFHPADEITGPIHAEVRDRCYALAVVLSGLMPLSREASLCITRLEESMMWANAAIARHNEPSAISKSGGDDAVPE
jgi:hypothetical protein